MTKMKELSGFIIKKVFAIFLYCLNIYLLIINHGQPRTVHSEKITI